MRALKISRRTFGTLLGGTALLGISPLALAQEFPIKGKPIRILVPFPPAVAPTRRPASWPRSSAMRWAPRSWWTTGPAPAPCWQPAKLRARSPDGHTILYAPSSTMAQNPHTLAQVSYDPFKDFTPISLGGRGPLVLMISTSVPANNVRELVAYIKAHPGTGQLCVLRHRHVVAHLRRGLRQADRDGCGARALQGRLRCGKRPDRGPRSVFL